MEVAYQGLSHVHEILQARMLEQAATPSSRGLSLPTQVRTQRILYWQADFAHLMVVKTAFPLGSEIHSILF